jgi:hypothetical protein
MASPFQGMTMEMQQAMFNYFMASQAMQAGVAPAVPPPPHTVTAEVQPNPPVVPQVVTGALQQNPPAVQPVVQQVAATPTMVSVQPPSLTIPTATGQRSPPGSFLTRAGQPVLSGGSQNFVAAGTTATNQQNFDGTPPGVSTGGSSSGLLEDGEEVDNT